MKALSPRQLKTIFDLNSHENDLTKGQTKDQTV